MAGWRSADRDDPLPASFGQARLWFLDRLSPGSSAYNVPVAFRAHGPLDAGALAAGLEAVVARHEALRTAFDELDGEPRQRVAAAVEVVVERRIADSYDAARAEALAFAEGPFDLRHAPLWRAAVWKIADDDHLVVIVVHHVVFDGWSLGVLLADWAAAYAGALLPEPPVQPADVAVAERTALHAGELADDLEWWRRRLAGAPEQLPLPTDRRRPDVESHRGDRIDFRLPPALTAQLRDVANRRGATLFMATVAVLDVLLARYSGEDDIVVGCPIAGRDDPDLEPLVGFFVNTLALRVRLGGDPTFAELVDRARDALLDASAHQHVPFELVVGEVADNRDVSRHPVFQVAIALQNEPSAPPSFPGVTVEPVALTTGTARFDLEFQLVEDDGGGVTGYVEYATDLFDRGTVELMVEHYLGLCASAVAAADVPVADLEVAAAPPRAGTVAVVGTDVHTSDAELDVWAARVAAQLQRAGVHRGDRVGVVGPRSAALVATWLGVSKAGAAYVPLDDAYPPERLAGMIADAGVAVIVGPAAAAANFPGGVAWVDPDDLGDGAYTPVAVGPDDLAYVMYTSGSTGQPKGIGVSHGAIAGLVTGADYVQLGPDDVVAFASSPSFDAATFEVWGALGGGGSPRDCGP